MKSKQFIILIQFLLIVHQGDLFVIVFQERTNTLAHLTNENITQKHIFFLQAIPLNELSLTSMVGILLLVRSGDEKILNIFVQILFTRYQH